MSVGVNQREGIAVVVVDNIGNCHSGAEIDIPLVYTSCGIGIPVFPCPSSATIESVQETGAPLPDRGFTRTVPRLLCYTYLMWY